MHAFFKNNNLFNKFKTSKFVRHTTILCVRKGPKVVMIGDGQASFGNVVLKPNVVKIRKIDKDRVMVGVAGSTSDALSLLEILEKKLLEYPGQLKRACVEMTKSQRNDKIMRKYEAHLVVADEKLSLLLSGNGDVIEPFDNILAIGSGGFYATAASRALIDFENLTAEQIARKAMKISSDLCIYTNNNFTLHSLNNKKKEEILDES